MCVMTYAHRSRALNPRIRTAEDLPISRPRPLTNSGTRVPGQREESLPCLPTVPPFAAP